MPDSLSPSFTLVASLLAILLSVTCLARRARYLYCVRNLPYVHDISWPGRWLSGTARHEFISNFAALMRKGFAMVRISQVDMELTAPAQPKEYNRLTASTNKNENAFRVETDLGEVIILSPQYAEEIRDDAGLSAGVYTNIVKPRGRCFDIRSWHSDSSLGTNGVHPGNGGIRFFGHSSRSYARCYY